MDNAQGLWKKILVGLVAGAFVGFLLSPAGGALVPEGTASTFGAWLGIPGVIFLGLISMVIIPLIVSSIILGISGSRDAGFVKRIGIRLVPYFIITSIITVLIGIFLAETIRPGDMMDRGVLAASVEEAQENVEQVIAGRSFGDLSIPERISNLIPTNPVRAALNLDLLQMVIGSILIGIVVLTVPRASVQSFMDLCSAAQTISMKIIDWAMVIAPIAVFGLVADAIIKVGPAAFVGLGGYVLTVLSGLLCVMIFYALIVWILGRRSPIEFFNQVRAVQLLSFSTSSSAAVMPVSLKTAEEKLGINPDIARFVVPLGTTINMDGTGLYQAVAAVFLCQFFGIELSFLEMLLLAFTMVGASIGTPSTPGAGIIVLATIVTSLGVPPEGIGLILGVDRILDMCRTTVNVTGDLAATTVMDRWLHGKEDGDKILSEGLSA